MIKYGKKVITAGLTIFLLMTGMFGLFFFMTYDFITTNTQQQLFYSLQGGSLVGFISSIIYFISQSVKNE